MSILAGHANSYHPYSAEEALAGIAEAGYRYVELSAVPGWTEHVDVHADPAETRAQLEHFGLEAASISGHSDLTTREGLEHGLAVVRWADRFGLPIVNTAIGGHAHVEESEDAFLANIGTLADAAQAAGLVIALEIHGDLMASGERSIPLLDRIGHPAVKVNYDTANVEHYGGDAGGGRPADDRRPRRQRAPEGHARRARRLGLPGDRRRPRRLRARAGDPPRRRLRRPVRGRDRVHRRAVAAARRGHRRDARVARRARPARAVVIGVALLGAGFMARTHAAVYAEAGDRAQVRVVCARSADDARPLAESLGAEVVTDWDAAIAAAGVDAVDICLPTPLHRPVAERALAAGRHVLLEKPMALTLEDADAIGAAAGASEATLMVGHVLRFLPEVVELRRVLATGELGRPLAATALRLSTPPDWNEWMLDPDRSGGTLVDLMVHDFDLAGALLGPARRVHARASAGGRPRHGAGRARGRGGSGRGQPCDAQLVPVHGRAAGAVPARRARAPVRGGRGTTRAATSAAG